MKPKIIFWDFDGVILDSNDIREQGFAQVLSNFPSDQVNELLIFHKNNGGLSRYFKFKYFFSEIRGELLDDARLSELTNAFSQIMLQSLSQPGLIIKETLEFIATHHCRYPMHVVSASDQTELRSLCGNLSISDYFESINGSPTAKVDLLGELIKSNNYHHQDCILIGDSVNDFNAAEDNNIFFLGYRNLEIKSLGGGYLRNINQLKYFL